MKKISISVVSLLLAASAHAQVVTSTTTDGNTLVNALLAPSSGITTSSITYVGVANQSATYSNFTFAGGIGDGIVLTSGTANFASSNTSDSYTVDVNRVGDAAIDAFGLTSYDANSLSFSFNVGAGVTSISANFIFASEEFPEFAGTPFADGFAFVVDGVNYAKFENGNVVSLKSVVDNSNMIDNTANTYPIQYDGFTPMLNVTGILNASLTTHTLKIVVADTGDHFLDSAAFISGLKAGTATGGGGITAPIPEPETYAMLLAGLGLLGVVARRRKQRETS